MKPRVLLWSDHFWPSIGGVEVLAARFVQDMRQRGYEFMVIAGTDSEQLVGERDWCGIPVHRFRFRQILADRDLDEIVQVRRRIVELKRLFRPDLQHVYFFECGALFHTLTAAASAAPLLVTLHGVQEDERYGPRTAFGPLVRSADWLVACSSDVLRETQRQLPEVVSRSSMIRSTLEPPELPPARLSFDPPRLLCLGRLSPEKGFDVAVAAFGRLARRFPTARLVVAGEGAQRAGLEALVSDLRVRDRVDFLGWVLPQDVPALLNSVTVVIVPSRSESLGLVAVQAAQMARPVVASRVGGLPEVVTHGETGLLVPPESPAALAGALAELLEQPDRAARFGQNAFERARADGGWQSHLDAYDALYRQLVNPQRS